MDLPGRNRNELLEFGGERYFKKTLMGNRIDVERRMKNLQNFNSLYTKYDTWQKAIRTPEIKKIDKQQCFVVYDWVDGKPLSDAYNKKEENKITDDKDRIISDALDEIGRSLRTIHDTELDFDDKLPNMNFIQGISICEGIDPKSYANCTGGEIEAIAIIQNDSHFVRGMKNIKRLRESVSCVPSHGDMRIDQILVTGSKHSTEQKITIVDFEEFCRAPREYDIGGLVGSIYFQELLVGLSVQHSEEFSDEEVESQYVERADNAISLAKRQEQVLLNSYGYTSVDHRYLSIEAAWAITERILSRAKYSAKLSAIDKSILGIARQMMKSS